MRMRIHGVCSRNYLQNNIMDELQRIMKICIGICETEGVSEENCWFLRGSDLSAQIN